MDVSTDGYEQVYEKSGSENTCKYYEGYLEKKEKKWTRYWCVLKKQDIFFFNNVNTQIKENYVGFFHLENGSKVEIIKSKENKYEWVVKTSKGKITLKTHVENVRDAWVKAMVMSSKHERPDNSSYILEGSGPVSPTRSVGSPRRSEGSPSSNGSRKESLKYNEIDGEQLRSLQQLERSNAAIPEELQSCDLNLVDNVLGKSDSWFLPSCVRTEAEEKLQNEMKGTFIVRDHYDAITQHKTGYVISLKDQDNKIRHHRVDKRENVLYIKGYETKRFETLHELLRYFILSQRNKLQLVPYDPNKKTSSFPTNQGYEFMDRPLPKPPISTSPLRAVGNRSNMVRKLSLQNRTLPEPPPSALGRSVSQYHHPNRHEQPSFPNVPPPPTDLPYMEMNTNSPSCHSDAISEQSYINIKPVQKTVTNPSTSYSPESNMNYANMIPPPLPPPRNDTTQISHPYINLQARKPGDDQAPRLPPKKRSSSLRETDSAYINSHERPRLQRALTETGSFY